MPPLLWVPLAEQQATHAAPGLSQGNLQLAAQPPAYIPLPTALKGDRPPFNASLASPFAHRQLEATSPAATHVSSGSAPNASAAANVDAATSSGAAGRSRAAAGWRSSRDTGAGSRPLPPLNACRGSVAGLWDGCGCWCSVAEPACHTRSSLDKR